MINIEDINCMKALLWALCRYESMYRQRDETNARQYKARVHQDENLSASTKVVLSQLLREYLGGPDQYADFLTDIQIGAHVYAGKNTVYLGVLLGLSEAQIRLAFQELELAGWIKKAESEVDLPDFQEFRNDGYRFDWKYDRQMSDIDIRPHEEVRAH